MSKCKLLTLNGKKMVDSNFTIEQIGTRWKASFKYNLSKDNFTDRDIIICKEKHDENALFYQLMQCLGKTISVKKNKDIEDLLLDKLIFIDFKEVFMESDFSGDTYDDYKEKGKDSLEGEKGIRYRLRWIFDAENGIQITFDNKKWITFVPFDKSSSMARNCVISFIDKNLKELIDKRLTLDIDFTKIKLISSKYYAYRGLYLSSGYRIEQTKDGDSSFCLTPETVIVIDDICNHETGSIYTARNIKTKDNPDYEFYEEKEEKNDLNAFDGEGLICPDYVSYINKQLKNKYGLKKDTHSIQVRMPFTKGMLHEVDFILFFQEQAAKCKFDFTTARFHIKDVFGIERDLKKAKIILTKSMLKCTGWFKDLKRRGIIGIDPMEYYFNKMKSYQHTLYVTNLDARLSDYGSVPLNYQFLSTLDISPVNFDSMVQNQIKRIETVPERLQRSKIYTQTDFDTDETERIDDEDSKKTQSEWSNVREKCLKALALNKAFLSDPMVKSIIKAEQQSAERALGMGRLQVSGEQRFLSCDLLELLRYIFKKSQLNYQVFPFKLTANLSVGLKKKRTINKRIIELFSKLKLMRVTLRELRKERIYSDRFYMPVKKMQLKPEKYYGFLRNPHLSKNEQCILRPYVNPKGLHEKYFSHLNGVVMISCESLVPMALSGADFDGDLVKIVCDSTVVTAIKENCYSTARKRANRLLPVVKIPSEGADPEYDRSTIPFSTIKNTFSNQIGLISNIAVKFAQKEQKAETISEKDYKDGKCCAGCTILTGLEIDAAKTGVHPITNIIRLQYSTGKKGLFLNAKDAIKKLSKKQYVPTVEDGSENINNGNDGKPEKRGSKNENTLTFYLRKADQKGYSGLSDIPFTGEEFDSLSNIDKLPGQFLKYLKDAKEKSTKNVKQINKDNICFKFQQEGNALTVIDKEKKSRLALITEAYLAVRSLAREVKHINKTGEELTFIGHVKTILNIQYDKPALQQKLMCGTEVVDALTCTYEIVKSALNSSDEVKKAVERMNATKWQYAAQKERAKKIEYILYEQVTGIPLYQPMVELLSNFDNNGFKIFFYILLDVKLYYESKIDAVTYLEDNFQEKDIFVKVAENEYFNELKQIYFESNMWKDTNWNQDLVKKCREFISEVFDGINNVNCMDTALEYACIKPRKDDNRQFFWNIFTEEEILKQTVSYKG